VIQSTIESLAGLICDKQQRRPRNLNEILQDVYADIFGETEDLSLTTGISALDNLLDGIEPGDLITIAAGTGVGKTAFALQVMKHMAKKGKKIMLYSQEMSDKQNAIRMLARESGVDLYKLKKSGRLDEAEVKKVEEAFNGLHKMPIEIMDLSGITVEDIRLDCVSDKDLDCIFVDHVGLMRLPKGVRASSRNDEITKLMTELRALALQIRKPVIVLSQFNREAMKKPEPDLQCLRDGGEIEQSSSAVILLWRTPDYDTDGTIGVKVAKNRQGAPGKFYMKFDAPRMSFAEVTSYMPKSNWKLADKKEIQEVFG